MQGSQDIWIRKLKLYRLKPFSFLSLKPAPRARSTPTTPGAASTTGGGQQALGRITTPILPSGGARLQVPKVRGHRVTRQGTPLTGHLPIYLTLNLILAESEHRFATYLSDSESHRGRIRTPICLPPAGSLLPAPPGPRTPRPRCRSQSKSRSASRSCSRSKAHLSPGRGVAKILRALRPGRRSHRRACSTAACACCDRTGAVNERGP